MHNLLCSKLFDHICSDTGRKLNSLLPPRNEPKYNLRNHSPIVVPHLKTGSFRFEDEDEDEDENEV